MDREQGRLHADFACRYVGVTVEIVVESNSGARSKGQARNPDYDARVFSLLEKFAQLDAYLILVRVESAVALKLTPEPERRQVFGADGPPLRLRGRDLHDLRVDIGRAVRAYSGGNNQKRIALLFTLPDTWQGGADDLRSMIDS